MAARLAPGGIAIPPVDPRALIPQEALDAVGKEAGASAGTATWDRLQGRACHRRAGAVSQAQTIGAAVKSALEVTATPRISMPSVPAAPAALAPTIQPAGRSYGRGPQPPGRARGGPVIGGKPYTVGEEGPEIFRPGRSGSITPNNKVGGSTNINVGGIHVSGAGDPQEVARAVSRELSAMVDAKFRGGQGDLGLGFV